MNGLQIHKAGIASSVQDSGRVGTLSIGIPPSGAMDRPALMSGQHQLGHQHDEAAIEMAYAEFAATLTEAHDVVVTGAPVQLRINQQACRSEGVVDAADVGVQPHARASEHDLVVKTSARTQVVNHMR